jgi:hypothetical protein
MQPFSRLMPVRQRYQPYWVLVSRWLVGMFDNQDLSRDLVRLQSEPLPECNSAPWASFCALRLTAVQIALMRRLVDYESPEPSRPKVETDRSLCKAVQENKHAQTDVPEHDHLDSTLPQTGCRRSASHSSRQFVLKWD